MQSHQMEPRAERAGNALPPPAALCISVHLALHSEDLGRAAQEGVWCAVDVPGTPSQEVPQPLGATSL